MELIAVLVMIMMIIDCLIILNYIEKNILENHIINQIIL